MVEILTLHGPKGTRTFPESSEKVRSKFRAIGRADSTAPSSGRARHRNSVPQQYVRHRLRYCTYAQLGMKCLQKFTRSRNSIDLHSYVGAGKACMVLIFFSSGQIPCLFTTRPRKVSDGTPNWHLLGFMTIPFFARCSKSNRRCAACSSSVRLAYSQPIVKTS